MNDKEKNELNEVKKFDDPNSKARALVDQMFMSMSYVDKEGNRYATSLEEADLGEKLLNQAEEAIVDDSDTELMEAIATNREHIKTARTRSYTFAWWLVIAASLVMIFSFYNASQTMGKRISPEFAKSSINSQINSLNQSIANLELKDSLSLNEKEYLEKSKENLATLKDTTPEDYAADFKSRHIKSGIYRFFGALISLGWILLYVFASKPYGYMQFKRKQEYAVIQKATGWGAKIAGGILGAFWSMPITTYVTRYTDGTKETSSDALIILGLQIGVTVIVIGSILYFATVIIPFVAILAYIRNYPDRVGAKQVNSLLGEGKGFVSKYIDKLKGKAA
jgi:hypothetical protein